jgi:hypothetical protein
MKNLFDKANEINCSADNDGVFPGGWAPVKRK